MFCEQLPQPLGSSGWADALGRLGIKQCCDQGSNVIMPTVYLLGLISKNNPSPRSTEDTFIFFLCALIACLNQRNYKDNKAIDALKRLKVSRQKNWPSAERRGHKAHLPFFRSLRRTGHVLGRHQLEVKNVQLSWSPAFGRTDLLSA